MKVALITLVAMAFAGCGSPTRGGDNDTAPEPHPSRWIPYIDGSFERVFRPEGSRYLNDHSLIRDGVGRWHLYGITDASAGIPQDERNLLHATATSLSGPWSEEPDVLMTMGDERVLWAPFVFAAEDGRWLMYFWAGTPDGRTQRAESTDLFRWTRDPRSVPGGRDPFVLRVGSEWLFYSVGVSTPVGDLAHGQIVMTRSSDLEHWSTPLVVLQDPSPSFGWGNLESPTIAVRDDGYYLFITRTSEAPTDYARTMVFHSIDPARFAWAPVTEMLAHAAEVFDVDGQSYITAAGWTSMLGDRWRGLSLAKLGWARRPDGG